MNSEVNEILATLQPKDKDPHSVSVLARWIDEAENELGAGRSGRLSWLVASVVATAMLQKVVDEMGKPLFLLKGGTLLQHRLGLASRATKDLDGLVRADIDQFMTVFDEKMREGWGAVGFSRSEVTQIRVPGKAINPRQFDLALSLKGRTRRKVTVEISPDEGRAGSYMEEFPAPPLDGFGLPTPDELVGLAMCYQLAQKIHAASAPHNPPDYVNYRARDIVDILLIKRLTQEMGSPNLAEMKMAIEDIFAVRAQEAALAGRVAQELPPVFRVYSHWEVDYKAAADSAGIELGLEDAVARVNDWVLRILR